MKGLPQKRKRTEANPPFRQVLTAFLGLNENKDDEDNSDWAMMHHHTPDNSQATGKTLQEPARGRIEMKDSNLTAKRIK